ncbi:MAG: dihydropteroate synthase [Calditrichaeota bacterium]|nr:dihydropteroate synthase [Calditrichota bacterium]MCB9366339.1 dihydropteroate synthase [Calditrichota bacterium]
MPESRRFRHRRGSLELGRRTLLMGIVNVTPDSFSDGGRYLDSNAAVVHALKLVEDGADIVDLGAESTRPGSTGSSDAEQLNRLLPVLEKLRKITDSVLSIDTRSSVVARECLELGADMINDVSGLEHDHALADVCHECGAGLVIMHMRGKPETMQTTLAEGNPVPEVKRFLESAVARCLDAGLDREHLLVDPGLGFGKSFEQNHQLLNDLCELTTLGAGVLVGPSRKAFTGELSGLPPDARQFSTAAAVAIAILHGADIVRVHDVKEMREVSDFCDRFRSVHAA